MTKITTIKVTTDTVKKLKKAKIYKNESYDEILKRFTSAITEIDNEIKLLSKQMDNDSTGRIVGLERASNLLKGK